MKSSFPNSSQFSPTQTPLPELLIAIKANQPDRARIKQIIAQTFFSSSPDPDLADNTIYALSEYQLLDKPKTDISYATLSPLGESLTEKARRGEFVEMYEEFAKSPWIGFSSMCR
jgi:hypothetical protein